MPEKRWKAQERRIARLLNAKRNPHGDPGAPDVENAMIAVEVKDRREIPQWLQDAVAQSNGKAKPLQLSMVVLTSPKSSVDYLVMDLKDYREWYIGIPKRQRR